MKVTNQNYAGELQHFGVLGMKWGKHKQRSIDYKNKLKAISKNKSANSSDIKRAKYRSQSYITRFGKTAGTIVTHQLLRDMLMGNLGRYSKMNKKQLFKEAGKIATNTAINVALKDALAKSVSKKYTNNGKLIKGRKHELISREDLTEISIGLAYRAATLASVLGGLKLRSVALKRKANREQFEKWGSNILSEKVDNVIWQSPDLGTSVIDNRRR